MFFRYDSRAEGAPVPSSNCDNESEKKGAIEFAMFVCFLFSERKVIIALNFEWVYMLH